MKSAPEALKYASILAVLSWLFALGASFYALVRSVVAQWRMRKKVESASAAARASSDATPRSPASAAMSQSAGADTAAQPPQEK